MPSSSPRHYSSSSSTSSPSRSPAQPPAQLEILYNVAVQSFVRRDHLKTQSTLARLLDLVSTQPPPSRAWFELSPSSDDAIHGASRANGRHGSKTREGEREREEWKLKILKLYISSHVSLYSDPPSRSEGLSEDIIALLPTTPPDRLLSHLKSTCDKYLLGHGANDGPSVLPPSIVCTLLLASLKLTPAGPALDWAHSLAEEWLSNLPDDLLRAVSARQHPNARNGGSGSRDANGHAEVADAEQGRRIEAAREGYLKVVELFVGEVLVKEGEWDMARSFLDGEGIMPSKRKENLFRHIRAAQSKPRSNASSPANSGLLPPPAVAQSPSPQSGSRSRADSSSAPRTRASTSSSRSSSSEATARPTNGAISPSDHLGVPSAAIRKLGGPERRSQRKGKSRDTSGDKDDSVSEKSSLPSRLYVNHSPAGSTRDTYIPHRPHAGPSRSPNSSPVQRSSTSASWEAILSLLPKQLQSRLTPILRHPWILAAISIPLPLAFLFVTIVLIRRKVNRLRNVAGAVAGAASAAGAVIAGDGGNVAGTGTAATTALAEVRARLRRARERGMLEWIRAWIGWWIRKFIGVWRMGTTITYL